MELQKIQDENLLWKLFKSTFIISAFTIGGGFVIIPLLKAKFVDEYKWLDDKEVEIAADYSTNSKYCDSIWCFLYLKVK